MWLGKPTITWAPRPGPRSDSHFSCFETPRECMRRCPPKRVTDPLLRVLYPAVGSVEQAANELRWLKQELPHHKLVRAATLRGRYGYPLQYLLGSQPFGPLDIKCRRGVLIPRWETEEWVTKLARTIKQDTKVLDLCTGTGCALFLLSYLGQNVGGWGLDVSMRALQLFKQNQRALDMVQTTEAVHHNIFDPLPETVRGAQVVVANPPYIRALYDADYSVSSFEPRLALVEQPHIYDALINRVQETTATHVVFEVGDKSQIDFCTHRLTRLGWNAHGEKDSAGNWRTVWASKR